MKLFIKTLTGKTMELEVEEKGPINRDSIEVEASPGFSTQSVMLFSVLQDIWIGRAVSRFGLVFLPSPARYTGPDFEVPGQQVDQGLDSLNNIAAGSAISYLLVDPVTHGISTHHGEMTVGHVHTAPLVWDSLEWQNASKLEGQAH